MFSKKNRKIKATKNDEKSMGSDGSPVDSGFGSTEEKSSTSSSSSSLQRISTDDKQATLAKSEHGSTSTLSSTTSNDRKLDEKDVIESRIETFFGEGWQQPVSVKQLAEAGFRCTGEDEVECVSCGGRLCEWNAHDVPLKRHKQNFPKCSFVKYKRKQSKKKKNNVQFDSPKPTESEGASDNDEDAGNEMFISEFNRLITLKDWPLSSPVDRYDLAATGFYRVSPSSNLVKCYACEITIEEWNLGDRPKKIHEQLKPDCPHLKGEEIAGNEPLHSAEKQQAVNISIRNEGRAL